MAAGVFLKEVVPGLGNGCRLSQRSGSILKYYCAVLWGQPHLLIICSGVGLWELSILFLLRILLEPVSFLQGRRGTQI